MPQDVLEAIKALDLENCVGRDEVGGLSDLLMNELIGELLAVCEGLCLVSEKFSSGTIPLGDTISLSLTNLYYTSHHPIQS